MKKAFKLVGVVVTSLALLFASCSNDSISVETNATPNPDVVAIAYPGFNRIVWSPVTDGNTFSVIRDDGKSMWIDGSNVYDYDVEDGVEYTYTLYTASNASNSTETKVGNKTSVKVKAIKPAVFGEKGQLHALDLVYYEDGTYKADASQDFVVSAENIKVQSDGKEIYIEVPQKAYLNYTVKVYRGNSFELMPGLTSYNDNNGIEANARAAIKKDKIKTDVTRLYSAPIINAGEYRVEVTVSSYKYAEDKIIAKQTAKIEAVAIGGDNVTKNVKAYFFDNKTEKARVMWTPAKDSDFKLYPTDNYTVYAYNHITNELTKVTDKINATKNSNGDDVYYVDTTTLNKKYAVVLSVNGKYESVSENWYDDNDDGYINDGERRHNNMSNELVWYNEPEAIDSNYYESQNWNNSFEDRDNDGKYNDFVIRIDGIDKQKVSLKYFTYDPDIVDYASYNQNWFSTIFVSEDYVKDGNVTDVEESGDKYKRCVISNVPAGQKVAYQITVSEEGKETVVKAYISYNESRD